MQWFRTIACFSRVLVAFFMVAQFAGVISSPPGKAHAYSSGFASNVDHLHGHSHGCGGRAHQHGDQSDQRGDYCCALHAFFTGVLPPLTVLETVDAVGERLATNLSDFGAGAHPDRLDRPPRPLL